MEPLMSQPAATSSPDVDVAALRHRFGELRKRQADAGRTLVAFAFVVVALFGTFAYVTATRVRGNFDESAVRKAVAERLPEVMPLAGAQLQKAAIGALPAYRELAVERYEKMRPELAAKAMARLDGAPERAGKLMSERLDASFAKVLKRVEPELRQKFPALTDAQKQQILSDYFRDGIEVRNKEVAQHIERLYTNELIAVHSALEKFDLPATADGPADPDRLQRDFLHSLLVLADYEMTNPEAAKPVPAHATAKAGAPRGAQASAAD
jgi:hypothetical protein